MTTEPTRTRPYRILDWAPVAMLAWTVGYGGLRAYWAAGHRPSFEPLPDDLVILPGWGAVGLCAASGLIALGLRLTRRSRLLLPAAWTTVALTAVACAMFLLDVVGGVLFGLGIPLNLVSAASRAGMLAGAALLAAMAVTYRRRARGGCARCGRVNSPPRLDGPDDDSAPPGATGATATGPAGPDRVHAHPPRWAWCAAYLAVAGCLLRITAQLVVGFDEFVYGGPALIVFEAGFVAAGVLLPTALVHRFGLIWPRWTLLLAGRRVPRWLVLGPAFFVGVGLTVYFGFGLGQFAVEQLSGVDAKPYGAAFMWVAVSSYLVWGLGVGIAAIARFRQTRPRCRRCGNPAATAPVAHSHA